MKLRIVLIASAAVFACALFLLPRPALADDCDDAFNADDWGTAAAACQSGYEEYMRESRHDTGREHYLDLNLAAQDLADAGYSNLHFDRSTGVDQMAEAILEVKRLAADPKCPADLRADAAKEVDVFTKLSEYISDDDDNSLKGRTGERLVKLGAP